MHLFDPRLPKLVQFSEDPILDFEPRIVNCGFIVEMETV